ncbi:FAD/NAD-binding domain-containing protein [Fomitiporia mediterranea MF3/22]|uniref:FAD/NAD-binding domain-containing protein n=1 Tax=Fomitiporia mediterranea (strain MF3/22) TaxID=694068 RepID=UPI00044092FB|nr:FAD/NAD-binding domain-containing protein [Fomitiporia mediterranea MF3/22]EJC98286.1 FAD/NAD-binding domain-containing protein [Fomitiporia mediterranea MF3/22]
MTKDQQQKRPIRVAIVGAGSAGMAAGFALTNHPEKFHVTIFDKQNVCGGMATSIPIDAGKFGASYINDGVQGGSPQFYNTFKFFEKLGFKSSEVGMQISFGKGKEKFWTNVFPSELVAKHADDIKKFGRVLKIIKCLEPLFAVMSVQAMLKLFRFPKDFGDRLIYPLIALFMGTGNQTPHVSSAILERLFLDPSMSLFEYSPDSLLAEIPTMLAFPNLNDVYAAWKKHLEERGARICLGTEVLEVLERKKGRVILRYKPSDDEDGTKSDIECFDELIFAADADSCLKMLEEEVTWKEKKILGNVKYFYDISVTHYDREYMTKYYELDYKEDLVSSSRKNDGTTQEAMAYAEKSFRPLYFIHMYDQDPKKIEMSFDLTHYQPQFKGIPPNGQHPANDGSAALSSPPSQNDYPHVYQTIFLNKDMQNEWTRSDIEPSKVIKEKWWKQQGHNWTHYLGTVPWLWMINGKNHTHYAGGWGLVNMHEVGLTSGFAAAYQLGADYPFNDDER